MHTMANYFYKLYTVRGDYMFIADKIRYWVYALSDLLVVIVSIICVLLLYLLALQTTLICSREMLSTTCGTMAAFLLAAQSILVSLPSENAFVVFAAKHRYTMYFHRFCKRAESIFVVAIFPILYLGKNAITDRIIIFLIIAGMLYVAWAVYIFGKITSGISNGR